MKSADDVKRFFKNATINTNPVEDRAVLADALGAAGLLSDGRTVSSRASIWRLTMRNPVAKPAAAAAAVLITLGAWLLWSGTQPGIVLAHVLKTVEQVPTFMYRETMHIADMEVTSLISSSEHGMLRDTHAIDRRTGEVMIRVRMHGLPDQDTMLVLLPGMKNYMLMETDEEALRDIRQYDEDVRTLIRRVLECRHDELGKSILEGVPVEGFRTTDPGYANGLFEQVDVRLWVDAQTSLPVRVEMSMKTSDQVQMQRTLYDFQWNGPLSAAEFIPDPDEQIGIAWTIEETAIEGLRRCVAITGKYPRDLDPMTLMFIDAGAKGVQNMESIIAIQMLGRFYASLVQEQKEPAYYGYVVQPGDEALVLLRWKTGENEHRVIFGDLHADTVDADTLAKLEAALPQ